ncbi:MAG: exodeoxyribonuclease V subunit gamma [Buchnera aphidicola (Meitanaphis flavogallis)]
MFILYKSYNFHCLIKKACSIITTTPLCNPLANEIFITPNKTINHWTKIFIAQQCSIASNIKFLKFNEFAWTIFQHINLEKNSKSEFEKYHLIWKMMNIKNIKNLTKFVSNSNSKIKLFEIVSFLSQQFKEYLSYRPDLIHKWEQFSENQLNINLLYMNQNKLLWTTLIKYMQHRNQPIWNYANLLFLLEKKIKQKKININTFPSRIFVFGNDILTPYNIIMLKKISNLCSIYFFYITPYKNEKMLLREIKSQTHQCNLIQEHTSHFFKATICYKKYLDKTLKIYNNIENILLWGKYGYDYTLLLSLISKKEINLFNIPKPTSLLNKIQKNIIQTNFNLNIKNNKNNANYNINKQIIYNNDKSISIHICTTLKREIEVLHDNLLDVLNNHYDILFHDILIISKNINKYVPFIHSIFHSINPKHRIPFYITSTSHEDTNTISNIILQILDLPNNPLNEKDIFNFLKNSFILKKFNIKEKEIIILSKIIKKFHIKSETNHTFKKHKLSKINKEYTFSNNEKRIFLGKAINDVNYTIWNTIVPFNYLNEKHYTIFSKLITFKLLLHKWKKKLSISKPLTSWKIVFEQLLNDFFTHNEIKKEEIISIKKHWNKIVEPGIQEGYTKPLPVQLLKNELLKNISQKKNIYDCFSGRVTFCNGFILRSIPFKVICIIGMHDKFIIQKIPTKCLNLIHTHPRICDPYRKNKYEYLFLETILATQKILLISYPQGPEKNNKTYQRSILIDQLLSYISKNFYIFNKKCEKKRKENKKKLIFHLCYFHTDQPYNIKNFIKGSKYQSFNETWLKISQLKQKNKNNFEKTLQTIKFKNIMLSELIAFWKNPVQYFFNKRLHIILNDVKNIDLNKENFSITKLNHYIISMNIIDFLLKKKDTKKLLLYYQCKGIIPIGNLGEIYWENQIILMTSLYKKSNLINKNLRNKKFRIKINQYTLFGILKNKNKTGLLRWKPTTINNKDIISLWLEHLVYCSIYKPSNNTILGLKNNNCTFIKLKKKKAKNLLNQYIIGYIKGMHKPILLTNSGINWLSTIYDKKYKTISTKITQLQKSKENMITTWEGNNWKIGEKNDLYLKKIITTLDEKNVSKICATAKKWILPVLRYIQ